MSAVPDRKEWVRCSRGANGVTTVSVTLQEGNLSVKWAVKCWAAKIKEGVAEARLGATKALEALQEATQ